MAAMGRVNDAGGPARQPGPPAAPGSDGLLQCAAIITSTEPTPPPTTANGDDDERMRGRPDAATAAALIVASIGGLEMTDRLIISVSILSYIDTFNVPYSGARGPGLFHT